MSRKRVVTYVAERFDRELTGFSVGILHLKICDGRHREGQPESSGGENGPVVNATHSHLRTRFMRTE